MSIERTRSNHGSTEEIANKSWSENVEGEFPELQTLTQETINEQIRGFIAPQTRQLEALSRLAQGMATSGHPNSNPRTEFGTTSGTAMPHSDNHCRTEAWLYQKWHQAQSGGLNSDVLR